MALTRDEQLEKIKESALHNLSNGMTPMNAITTMCADLAHYPELANHKGIDIAMTFLVIGKLSTHTEAYDFINGFH